MRLSRTTGWFGLVGILLSLSQFPLYMTALPSVYDGVALGQRLFEVQTNVFTRVLIGMGLHVTLMVFGAGFSGLVRRARPDQE